MSEIALFAAAGLAETPDGFRLLDEIAFGVAALPLVLYGVLVVVFWLAFYRRVVTVRSLFVLIALGSVAALYIRVVLAPLFPY